MKWCGVVLNSSKLTFYKDKPSFLLSYTVSVIDPETEEFSNVPLDVLIQIQPD